MSDQTINLNHNAAQCIKSTIHFGYTTYHNICKGTLTTVDWGFFDWLGTILLCLGGLGLVLLIFTFVLCCIFIDV